jgi:hypothetical protein
MNKIINFLKFLYFLLFVRKKPFYETEPEPQKIEPVQMFEHENKSGTQYRRAKPCNNRKFTKGRQRQLIYFLENNRITHKIINHR